MAWCIFALFDRRAFRNAVLGVFALDIFMQFVAAVWAGITNSSFHKGAADLFLLALLRAALAALISLIAISWWRRGMRHAKRHIESPSSDEDNIVCTTAGPAVDDGPSTGTGRGTTAGVNDADPSALSDADAASTAVSSSASSEELRLLADDRPAVEGLGEKLHPPTSSAEDDNAVVAENPVEKKKRYINGVKRSDLRKTVLIYVLFMMCFAMSVYTGVKTVVFDLAIDDAKTSLMAVEIESGRLRNLLDHVVDRDTDTVTDTDRDVEISLFQRSQEYVVATPTQSGSPQLMLPQAASDRAHQQRNEREDQHAGSSHQNDDEEADTQYHSIFLNYLLGVGVFFINVEFFLLRDFINEMTKEDGELVKRLHPHPLFFEVNLQCHNCDVCHEKTQKPYFEAYRCRTCDFDLCPRCYKRKDNANFKGVAFREYSAGSAAGGLAGTLAGGDKKDDESSGSTSLTTYGYFKKCIEMCFECWPTMLLATGSLVVCQVLTLMAPNLQGQIFDAIIGKAKKAERLGGVGGPLVVDTESLKQMLDPYALFIEPLADFSAMILPDEDQGSNSNLHVNALHFHDAPSPPSIHPDVARFRVVMRLYVVVNVLSGLFNGLRSLGIELSMRSLAAITRRRLFHAMIQIDIPHFDAMHTGQLLSRLTNDVSAMVSPLSTIMNDLVSNAILLVGGTFMAFFTSWKLSILGICVVPPITFIYRVYSRWARQINRGIWQAYGDSNSIASEAISNIRTVRAFAAEDYEIGRYDEGVNVALKYGTKNAYVGASVQAFSSYMNLFTAILILWYGGTAVIDQETNNNPGDDPSSATHNHNQLTIGGLITFQLYWNLMNSAFLNLSNVFNQLIRASSAAERVFQIIDATNMRRDQVELDATPCNEDLPMQPGPGITKDKANLVKTEVPTGLNTMQGSGSSARVMETFQRARSVVLRWCTGFRGRGRGGARGAADAGLQGEQSSESPSTAHAREAQPASRPSVSSPTIVRGEPLLSEKERELGDLLTSPSPPTSARSSLNSETSMSSVVTVSEHTDGTSSAQKKFLPVASTGGEIELENVHFKYATRPENPVLNGINLKLQPNTVTALVGKSGGGKSTVIHLLLKFYDPTSGRILLDGRDMNALNAQDVRNFIGLVAQDTQLFASSILDNLLYGLPNRESIPTAAVVEACKLANAHEFIMETEDKYQTRVGEKGVMLSGGQKQRLALARCFLRKPKLLFLDEATSALDAENEALVQEGIDRLLQQCESTVLLIAHRLSTVMNADQIAVISGGEIVELGDHKSLVALEKWNEEEGAMKKGIYARLVDRQMKRDANVIDEEKLDVVKSASSGSLAGTGGATAAGAGAKKGGRGGGKSAGGQKNKTEIDELFDE